MSSNRQAKVLRIGIIQDGKLVQDRHIKAREPVTVGPGKNNTFQIPDLKIGKDSFTLFSWKDDRYHLEFVDGMKGKVSAEGTGLSLAKAQRENLATRSGDVWSLPLNEGDKGSVRIAPVKVIFRFDNPPPVAATSSFDQLDFRPKLLQDDDDPIFYGFLALWTALGIVFAVWVANSERPEARSMEELPDRFVKMVIKKPEKKEKVEEPKPDPDAEARAAAEAAAAKKKAEEEAAAKKAEEEAKKSEKPKSEQEQKVEKAAKVEAAKDELAQSSALFKSLQAKMIGTTGENARGSVLLENADGDYGDIAGKLAAAAEAGAAIGDGAKIRGGDGVPGGTGTRNVGDLSATENIGKVETVAKAAIAAPKGSVSAGDLDFGGGDVANVSKVVRRYQGQIKYCYESALKSNPGITGKVVIGWTVELEEAVDVYVVENTTGDPGVADCIKKKVSRWKFSGVEDGDATSSFVLRPEN